MLWKYKIEKVFEKLLLKQIDNNIFKLCKLTMEEAKYIESIIKN